MIKLFKKSKWVLLIILLVTLKSSLNIRMIDNNLDLLTIGVKQTGLTYLVPNTISREAMKGVLIFTENESVLLKAYTLKDDEYVLNNQSDESLHFLENSIKKPFVFYHILKSMNDDELKELFNNLVDISKMDVLTIFKHLNKNQINSIYNEYIKTNKLNVDNLFIRFLKEENKNLEINSSQKKYLVTSTIKIIGDLGIILLISYIILKIKERKNLKYIIYGNILLIFSTLKVLSIKYCIIINAFIILLELLAIWKKATLKNQKELNKIIFFIPETIQIILLIIYFILLIIFKNIIVNKPVFYIIEIFISIGISLYGIIKLDNNKERSH